MDQNDPPEPRVAEIMAVGNELLNGSVQDGNSFWLITRIMERGGVVRKVAILPDDEDVIAGEIRASLSPTSGRRPPDVLFITGGLGPTTDDLTLAGVARGLGLALRRHEQAREMIRRSYDGLAAKGIIAQGGLNPPREKMALLPEGAIPLVNPAGTAPGVLVESGATTIVCFPGVPGEMKSIFDTSLQPVLAKVFPAMSFVRRSVWIACNDESFLAPHLQRFAERFPNIHVKARSGIIAENPELEFVFTVGGLSEKESCTYLEAALQELVSQLARDTIHAVRK